MRPFCCGPTLSPHFHFMPVLSHNERYWKAIPSSQHSMDIQQSCLQAFALAGVFTRHAFPPSIPFSTRKPPAVLKYSTVTPRPALPKSFSPASCLLPLFYLSPLRKPLIGHITAPTIFCLHLALALDSKPTWNKCLVYQLSHIKKQFSEEVTSPLSIHTFL